MPAIGSGTLSSGQSEYYSAVLTARTEYAIYVEPSDLSTDFDIYVYDEGGHQIARDNDLSPNALCKVTPRWTGPFRIQVKCARGHSNYVLIVA